MICARIASIEKRVYMLEKKDKSIDPLKVAAMGEVRKINQILSL